MLLVLFHFNIEIKIMNIKQFKINWQNCFKMNKIINFGLQIFLMFSYSISNDYNQYRYSENIYSWRGLFSIKKRSVVQHEYISINHILHRFILQHVLRIKSVFWWFDFWFSFVFAHHAFKISEHFSCSIFLPFLDILSFNMTLSNNLQLYRSQVFCICINFWSGNLQTFVHVWLPLFAFDVFC